MDDKTEQLAWIIDRLKDDLGLAKSELSRLEYDEAANTLSAGDMASVAGNEPHGSHSQFGQVAMVIHYTLGHGVAEALGDNLEQAVYRAFHEASAVKRWSRAKLEVTYLGAGMLADVVFDREEKLAYLHLELTRTQQNIDTKENEAALNDFPEERSLN